MKPNCFDCQYRRNIPGDVHSECVHPAITSSDRILAPIFFMSGRQDIGIAKRLNVLGDQHGIKNGWFLWPLNFDPTWLITCDGFKKKGGDKNETKS